MNTSWSIADKRGVSEMLSYVLALLLVVSLSIATYAYLSLSAPKTRLACGSDVLVVVDPQDTTCVIDSNGALELSLVLENRGKHAVSGAYLRLGQQGTKIRSLLNEDDVFFGYISEISSSKLPPGARHRITISKEKFADVVPGTNVLEVEPLIGEGTNIVLCEEALVTQRISCQRQTP
jgi:hypothetical protein